jgi:hypothetical protein
MEESKKKSTHRTKDKTNKILIHRENQTIPRPHSMLIVGIQVGQIELMGLTKPPKKEYLQKE